MIKLTLGAEPGTLRASRLKVWPDVVKEFDQNGAGRKEFNELLEGYDEARDGEGRVKRVLWKRQHKKCGWCERQVSWRKMPVEHIRPKGGAWDLDAGTKKEIMDTGAASADLKGRWTVLSPAHYWWLTWTWENMVLSCEDCNVFKSNLFPIDPSSQRAQPPTAPLDQTKDWPATKIVDEKPWFLNPREESCLKDITWRPIVTSANRGEPTRWEWEFRARTPRGLLTIEVLHLNDHIELMTDRIREMTAQWLIVKEYGEAGRTQAAVEAWNGLIVSYINNVRAAFRAACYSALEHLAPPALRQQWNLRDPPIPEVVYTPPAAPPASPP